MNSLRLDLPVAWRRLRNSAGFTSAALISLALGIGGNLALLSIVNAVLWVDLPFRDAGRIVHLREGVGKAGAGGASYPNFLDLVSANRTLDDLSAFAPANVAVVSAELNARAGVEFVSEGYFELLGAKPAVGRFFAADEPAAVLSHGLWERSFGAGASVLGRHLRVGDASLAIVGVAPPGFRGFGDEADLWLPLCAHGAVFSQSPADFVRARDIHWLEVLGRLKPGASAGSVRANFDPVMRRLAAGHPAANQDRDHVVVASLRDDHVGGSRGVLWLVAGAALFVFLVACANIANLMLVRAVARDRETSVRLWLGASPGAAVRGLVIESALLAAGGALAGLLVAAWASSWILAILPVEVPTYARPVLDGKVAAASAVMALVAFALLVLPSLLRTPRSAFSARGASAGRETRRLRIGLVVLETALATVLLFGAVQMLRSLWNLGHQDLGFAPEKAVAARFQAPASRYRDTESRARFGMEVLARAQSLAGVEQAALTTSNPLAYTGINRGFQIEGGQPLRGSAIEEVRFADISPGYFETLGMALARGRDFTRHDDRRSAAVAIVSESFARRYFAGGDALGKRLRYLSSPEFKTIVGVVRDAKLRDIARSPGTEKIVFAPLSQNREALAELTVVARAAGDPESLVEPLRRLLREADPENAVLGAEPLAARLGRQRRSTANLGVLLGGFAALAAGLAALGVAGVLGHAVAARRREIGIRMALGANSSRVLKLVGLEAARMALAGTALGLLLAWWQAGVLDRLVFGLSARDTLGYVSVAGLLSAAGLGAAILPARAALRIDPAAALREE